MRTIPMNEVENSRNLQPPSVGASPRKGEQDYAAGDLTQEGAIDRFVLTYVAL